MARILSKIIVGLLALWATSAIISQLFGITIFFPFNIVDGQEFMPYHRLNSIRLKKKLAHLKQQIKIY